jgi:hypothetical protein
MVVRAPRWIRIGVPTAVHELPRSSKRNFVIAMRVVSPSRVTLAVSWCWPDASRARRSKSTRRCERAAPRAVELHGGEPALAERDVAAGSVRLGVHLGAPEAMTHDRRIHVGRAPARAPEAVRRKLPSRRAHPDDRARSRERRRSLHVGSSEERRERAEVGRAQRAAQPRRGRSHRSRG